ncbi:MAG TPA: transglycosylase SLT domain-containing protein [Burkholderiales bacterium]|nr:transglycosylase SLT domain-containing protein [Burkholderiales bacterium]
MRKLRSAPPGLVALGALLALAALWLAVNGLVQVVRKPSELFFPVSGVLHKSPTETWRHYEPMFRAHATAVVTADLLAALAQVESAGNPVARTNWRWRLTEDPFDVYRPASSAVGMFQITDGTFRQARRYCIHHHAVVEDGPWHDWDSCWFNSFYFRVVPSHAAEMTAAFLDRSVARVLARQKVAKATLRQKQELAIVMHLCGAGAGEVYARGGLRLAANQRCGGQDVHAYVERVRAMQAQFARLAERAAAPLHLASGTGTGYPSRFKEAA